MQLKFVLLIITTGLGLAIKAYTLYSLHQKAQYYRQLKQRQPDAHF